MVPPPLPYAPLGARRRRRGGAALAAAWARPLAAVAAGAASAYALASLYRRHVERLQEAARREYDEAARDSSAAALAGAAGGSTGSAGSAGGERGAKSDGGGGAGEAPPRDGGEDAEAATPNFFASTKFFACLELEESQELLEGTTSLELAANTVLFRQGDPSESGIYIVVEGALGIYLQEEGPAGVPEGPPLLTNVLHEGESVGDVDVVDAARRAVSAIAQAGGVRLVVVSRALFLSFVARHPRSLHTYLTQALARLWRVAHFVLADFLGLPRSVQERADGGGLGGAGESAAPAQPDGAAAATDAAAGRGGAGDGEDDALAALAAGGAHAAALAAAGRRVSLAAGEALYSERAPAGCLFLLLAGSTRADAVPWPLGQGVAPPPLAAPALLGAAAFLTRTPRRETVRADAAPAQLLAFGPDELEALLATSPDAFVALLLVAARALAPVIRRFIGLGLNRVWLAAGEAAFQRGAPASSLYILISGRVRLVRGAAGAGAAADATSAPVDGGGGYGTDGWDAPGGGGGGAEEAGRGDTIGEASLLAGGAYSSTAVCVRDSELVRMSRAAFELITARSPAAAARLLEAMARKLTRDAQPGTAAGRRPDLVTICILPAEGAGAPPGAPAAAAGALGAALAAALARFGPTLALDRPGAAARFADGTVARLGSRFYRSKLTGWMAAQEESYRFILLLAEPRASAWSAVCVSQADCVLVVGRAGDPAAPGAAEAQLLWRAPRGGVGGGVGGRGGGACRGRIELVLLHAPGPGGALPAPRGSAAWLDGRPLCRAHHHARSGSAVDAARVARHLAGRAVGVLLCGSGARGLAHLGALRALSDAGVPIDVVGGTSQGALVGAAFARGASTRNMMRRCAAFGALAGSARQLLADATLPLLSFFAGWGLEGNIRAALGDTAIEDLWLRFFCCSTNLSRGTLAVHERGPAARYVRAAQTVLGLLPPVADAGGDLLVDGGYLNNFPVDVMHERMGCDTVIVVDVDDREASSALRMLAPVDGGVSGWRLLWEKANPLARSGPPSYAALVSALTAAVAARQLAAASRAHPVHLHLRPRVAATYSVLSTADMERIVRGAYKYAFAAVVDWQMRGAGGGGGAEGPGGGLPGAPALAAAPVPGVATPPGAAMQQPPGGGSTIGLVRGTPPVAPRAVASAPLPSQPPGSPPREGPASPGASLTPLRRAGAPGALTGARRSVSHGLASLSGASPPAVATPPAREADAAAAAAIGAGGSPRRAPVSKSNSWNGVDGVDDAAGAADGGGVVSQLSARYAAAAEASPRGSAAEAPPEVAAALQRAGSAEGAPAMLRRNSSGARLRRTEA